MLAPQKIHNLLRLSPQSRCDYLIRKVADFQVIWGLFADGWATAGSAQASAIAFWPEAEFAAWCAHGPWHGFEPKPIELDHFLSHWLPGMQRDARLCLVFADADGQGLLLPPESLLQSLTHELDQYQ